MAASAIAHALFLVADGDANHHGGVRGHVAGSPETPDRRMHPISLGCPALRQRRKKEKPTV
jgi:hypothetical protein